MSIEKEKAGLAKVIRNLKAQGWQPYKVWDGGSDVPVARLEVEQVAEECCTTDESTLHFACGKNQGYTLLVWGNSPSELIADNSMGGGFDEALNSALRQAFPGWPNCEDTDPCQCQKCHR
jgi:hypothetical protein